MLQIKNVSGVSLKGILPPDTILIGESEWLN